MKQNKFPIGWDEERVLRVLAYYETQTEEEAVAEDEAAYEEQIEDEEIDFCEKCEQLKLDLAVERAEVDRLEKLLGADRKAMRAAAEEYYLVLQGAKEATPEEKQRLEWKLDKLAAPFSDNIAYHAFLRMERLAAGFEDEDNDTNEGLS